MSHKYEPLDQLKKVYILVKLNSYSLFLIHVTLRLIGLKINYKKRIFTEFIHAY